MTLLEHVRLQARAGLDEIDRERDAALTFEARYGGSPALDVYLRGLEAERARHLLVVAGLAEPRVAAHPALLQQVRVTRMAKAVLRPAPEEMADSVNRSAQESPRPASHHEWRRERRVGRRHPDRTVEQEQSWNSR